MPEVEEHPSCISFLCVLQQVNINLVVESHTISPFIVLEARSPKSGASSAVLPLESLGKSSFLTSFCFWCLPRWWAGLSLETAVGSLVFKQPYLLGRVSTQLVAWLEES